MRKAKKAWYVMPLIILSLYLVFYSKIETKPDDAGFWIILALGISIGVIIAYLFKKK